MTQSVNNSICSQPAQLAKRQHEPQNTSFYLAFNHSIYGANLKHDPMAVS